MKIVVLGAAGAMAEVVRRDLAEFAPDADGHDRRPRGDCSGISQRAHGGGRRPRRGGDGAAPRGPRRGAELRHLLLESPGDARRARGAGPVQRPRRALPRDARSSSSCTTSSSPRACRRSSAWVRRPGSPTPWRASWRASSTRCTRRTCASAVSTAATSGPLPIPYALDTVLDEFALEPYVVEAGRSHPVPPRSGEEEIDFPPPVGRMRAIYTLHSEVAMFARSFPGLSGASFKVAFEPSFMEKVRFLVELGLRRPRTDRGRSLAAPDAAGAGRRAEGDRRRGRRARRLRLPARRPRRRESTAARCGGAASRSSARTRVGASAPAPSTPASRWRSPGSCWPASRGGDAGSSLPGDRAAVRALLRGAREARHPGRVLGTGPTGRLKERTGARCGDRVRESRQRQAVAAASRRRHRAEIEAALALAERTFRAWRTVRLRGARREDAARGGDPRGRTSGASARS